MGAVAADVWGRRWQLVAVAVGAEGVNATRERLRWTDSWGSCVWSAKAECRNSRISPRELTGARVDAHVEDDNGKSLGGRRVGAALIVDHAR